MVGDMFWDEVTPQTRELPTPCNSCCIQPSPSIILPLNIILSHTLSFCPRKITNKNISVLIIVMLADMDGLTLVKHFTSSLNLKVYKMIK